MVLLQSIPLPIGEFQAPDFQLPGTDGGMYSLNNFLDEKGLVVIFTCNHCPYAQAAWPILAKLFKDYHPKGISFVAINPNDEIAHPDDSFEEMKKKVVEWEIPFPYLRDRYQTVARAYKAQCTPDVYVFDKNHTLYYHGRINDRWQDQSKVTRHDLRDAFDSLLADIPPQANQVPSMGCSIKWIQ